MYLIYVKDIKFLISKGKDKYTDPWDVNLMTIMNKEPSNLTFFIKLKEIKTSGPWQWMTD